MVVESKFSVQLRPKLTNKTNMFGHFLKFLDFLFLHKIVVRTGLRFVIDIRTIFVLLIYVGFTGFYKGLMSIQTFK